ncbi:MAG: ATP-binding cassette domain-containing protein [Deltaproteobacteria bacterium]|nr:ATP-binding cassette domain-containing protein [Deltaproteobacteria bacterium]
MIAVRDLTKHFRVHRRQAGFRATLASLFRRHYETVKAVAGISFQVDKGERVGFLGPNGAGKTTTLKMLSGLLHPTSGELSVAGYNPQARKVEFLKEITLVMGQKQQLIWDLPPAETYELNRAIFDIPRNDFDDSLAELVELLELGELITKPTRQLSLGERMKCELVAALLHRPKVLFLDEPTIGLDVEAQVVIRNFVRDYNQRNDATVVLTSHYMEDVVALCPRVIVIDRGSLIYDGDLAELVAREHPDKLVSFTVPGSLDELDLERMGKVISKDEGAVTLRVPRAQLRDVVAHAVSNLEIGDLSVKDPPLEETLRQLFGRKADAGDPQ